MNVSVKRLCVMLGFGLLTACGGGGGGGDGASAGGAYSGVTTPATVTSSNAVPLSADAYKNGGTGAAASMVGVVAQGEQASSSQLLPGIGTSLKSSIARALRQPQPSVPSAMGASVTETMTGAYGGSASFTFNVNESSGAFTGSMVYANLKEGPNGPVISGSVTISGSYNQSTDQIGSMTITFSALKATTTDGTSTLNGTMSVSTSATTETLTISCTLQGAGKTYWIHNWVYTITSNTLTLTGRYYDPTYGYVDITTVTPLTVSYISDQPTSGVLLFTGSNGSKAKVTFTSSGYTVTVDTAGNGQFLPVP